MSLRIFLASSQESVDSRIVELLARELDAGGLRVTHWKTIFPPSQYPIEALLENARSHDSAAFVFAGDDVFVSRNSKSPAVRDNVLLEFGIFLGSLERSRIFVLQEMGVRKPSDLHGLTVLEYPRDPESERAEALRKSASIIATALGRLGPMQLPPADSDGLHSHLQAFEAKSVGLRRFLMARAASEPSLQKAPIVLDSRSEAISLYQWGLDRIQSRYWTTSFLKSGFWVNADVAFPSNRRMLQRLRASSPDIRRLLLFDGDPRREIERTGKEIRDLYRLGRENEMDGLMSTLQKVRHRHEILEGDGCKVRVSQLAPHNRHMHLSSRSFDLVDMEMAIFDGWRLDFYPGGRHGVIEGVEVYCAGVTGFDTELHAASELFEELWYHSAPADAFFRELDAEIRLSLRKIDYRKNWVLDYEYFAPQRDSELREDELRRTLSVLDFLGVVHGQCSAYLDVGTCTGRYPRALGPYVRDDGLIWGIDVDRDCIRMARQLTSDDRIRFTVNDFLAEDFKADVSFDLITCMLGTLTYFNFDRAGETPVGSQLRATLRKLRDLLAPGGVLLLSNWSEDAVRDRDGLLAIYEPHDSRRLVLWTPPTWALEEVIKAEGLTVERSLNLGRLFLLGCRKVT
jgi:SAM-dependent methyltransferase